MNRKTVARLAMATILSVLTACGGGGGGNPPGATDNTGNPSSLTADHSPEAQKTQLISLLASPDSRLAGWQAVYAAMEMPVVASSAPRSSAGSDAGGIPDWLVWQAAAHDRRGQGIPLSDAGRVLNLITGDAGATNYGQLLLDDLRAAAKSDDPQTRLFGLFVRERIERGPSHVDILSSSATPDTAVIDLPTLQLVIWVTLRDALFQALPGGDAAKTTPTLPVGVTTEEKTPAKCSDFTESQAAQWLVWAAGKAAGGVDVGIPEVKLTGTVERIATWLNKSEKSLEKINNLAGAASLTTGVLSTAFQYLSMTWRDSTQQPAAFIRTKDTRNGPRAVLSAQLVYDDTVSLLGKEFGFPDGESLSMCFMTYMSSAFGATLSFPPMGPIKQADVKVEGGLNVPELVLFENARFARATTDDNGRISLPVLGRAQRQQVPDNATAVLKTYSVVVSATPEEPGLSTMAGMFFNGLTAPFGNAVGAAGAMLDMLKLFHWKETELFFDIQDWSTGGKWEGEFTYKVGGNYADSQAILEEGRRTETTRKASYSENWKFEINPSGKQTEIPSRNDLYAQDPVTHQIVPTESPKYIFLDATATVEASATYQYKKNGSQWCGGEGTDEDNGFLEWNDSDSYTVTRSKTFPTVLSVKIYSDGHYEVDADISGGNMEGTEEDIKSSVAHPGTTGQVCGGEFDRRLINRRVATTATDLPTYTETWGVANHVWTFQGTLTPNVLTMLYGAPPATASTRTMDSNTGSVKVPVTEKVEWSLIKQ